MKSDQIKKGVDRAPNRSLLYALGLTEEEQNRPIIGVVSSYNEIVPGHMNLDKIADAVKAGIRAAGGTPILVGKCDPVTDGDGREKDRGPACCTYTGFDRFGDLVKVHVSRNDLVI